MSDLSPTSLASSDSRNGEAPFFDTSEHSGWVHFRVRRSAGNAVPVRIGKDALKEVFGNDPADGCLLDTYLRHAAHINARALELAPAGSLYTVDNPMTLGRSDFA